MSVTQERLQKMLRYDRESGLLYWRVRAESEFRIPAYYEKWIMKAGKLATECTDRGRGDRSFIRLDGAEYSSARAILKLELNLELPEITYLDGNQLNTKWDNIKHNKNCDLITQAKQTRKYTYWDGDEKRWRKFPRLA